MAREADESDEEEADGQDVESRMQRVRTERRELHSAVGSERCAGQSPTASQSPQRAFDTLLDVWRRRRGSE